MANKQGITVRTTIDPETHRKAKAAAALQGVTLADWLRQSLAELAKGKKSKESKERE